MSHPDQEFASYILRGIEQGFRVGFDANRTQPRQRSGNLLSAIEQPEVIQTYLDKEVAAGRVAKASSVQGIHCSPFGAIPKKSKPGQWRLLLDLSSPEGHSVNDGIAKELATLSYVSIDQVVTQVLHWGRGSLLAKMDVKHAFRNVPVHPEDRPLLSMAWQGDTFVDKTLPFGLRSAALIFSALADALAWMMKRKGIQWLEHYIDDFITIGPPGTSECASNVAIMHAECAEVGLPIEPEKDEGPDACISCLGLELDTIALEIRLPQEKLKLLKATLASWRGRKAAKKRELLSLVGTLMHASKAIRAGRAFTRRLIDLAKSVKRIDQFVRLSREARAEIEWWHQFATNWNGTATMVSAQTTRR